MSEYEGQERSPVNRKKLAWKVNESTGCHEVTSHSTTSRGYPQINRWGKKLLAHRYVWEREFGPIPDGMLVCHTCDNPLCVNIDHLFLGTDLDNMLDMASKLRGVNKLTPEQVREIRRRYKPRSKRNNMMTLGREFGVSHVAISDIVRGRSWKHLIPNKAVAI